MAADVRTLSQDTFVMRVGAALVAPQTALATADQPSARGKASTDFGALILLMVVAVHALELTTVLWLLADGEFQGALSSMLSVLARDLSTPLVLLLAVSLVLTLVAGKRRDPSRDFDLVCVTFIPLIILEMVLDLCRHFVGGLPSLVVQGTAIVGYGWAAALVVLAFLQTRRRRCE